MQYEKIQRTLCEYRPETELIIRNQLQSIITSKSKVKNLVKGHNPQKAHLHPLSDVCMQYESIPANGFRDIVRKQNTDARSNGRTARHGDDNILCPYFVKN